MEDTYDTLRWYDYLIFVVTLLIPLVIGAYYSVSGNKQKTTSEYLLGNRSLAAFPLTLSIYISTTSCMYLIKLSVLARYTTFVLCVELKN